MQSIGRSTLDLRRWTFSPIGTAFVAVFVLLTSAHREPAQTIWSNAWSFSGGNDSVVVISFGYAGPTNAVNTVRQNHNTFFVEQLYLDKILWLKIRLPGYHTTTNFTGWQLIRASLVYAGLSYIRNPLPGSPDLLRPDRLVNEWTAYSTRLWFKGFAGTNRAWRFKEAITNTVSLYKAPASTADRELQQTQRESL